MKEQQLIGDMNEILGRLNDSIFLAEGLGIYDLKTDPLATDYHAADFKLGLKKVKFRTAKVTQKKNGQFVTLWKRSTTGITEPYHLKDDFDCSIIVTVYEQYFGFFLFPKTVLAHKKFISSQAQEGKRGFRVYPDWDIPASAQAAKTKSWQQQYFINISGIKQQYQDKFNSIFKTINQ